MSAVPMLTKIPEKFGYLFDNMEQEMSLICDQDRAIDELRAAIRGMNSASWSRRLARRKLP
jgi:hypothetical protein